MDDLDKQGSTAVDEAVADAPPADTGPADAGDEAAPQEDRIEASLGMIDDLLKIVGDAWGEVEELRRENERLSGNAAQGQPPASSGLPLPGGPLKGILLIDDSRLLLMRLKAILEPLGYSVVGSAEDGRRAIELATRLRPQLAIIDYHMPGMNGLDCLRELKLRLPQMRAIVCTGTTTAEQMRLFVAAGASEVVLKPIQLDVFVRAVKRCIGESRSEL